MREVSFYGKRRRASETRGRAVSKHEMKPSLEVVGGVLPVRAGRVLSFLLLLAVGSVVQALTHSAARSPPLVVAIAPTSILAFLSLFLPLSLSLSLSPHARPDRTATPVCLDTRCPPNRYIRKHFRGKVIQSLDWGRGLVKEEVETESEASSATRRLVRLLEPRSRHGKVRPVGELSRRKTELRVSNVKQSRRSPASSGCPAPPPPQKAVRCRSEAGDELLSIMVSWPPQGRSLLALSRRGGQVG